MTNNKLPVKINNKVYIYIYLFIYVYIYLFNSKKYLYYEDKAKIKTVDIKKNS